MLAEGRPSFAKVGSQFKFMSMQDGALGVDRIYPIERMDLVSAYLTEKIGKKIYIGTSNISPKSKVFLDDTLRHRLLVQLRDDFELYRSVQRQV